MSNKPFFLLKALNPGLKLLEIGDYVLRKRTTEAVMSPERDYFCFYSFLQKVKPPAHSFASVHVVFARALFNVLRRVFNLAFIHFDRIM